MFEKVEIYSKSNCIFCDKAKHLFNSMNIEYVEHNAEDQATFTELMERNPAARTMPQIFINDQLIGGFSYPVGWVVKNNYGFFLSPFKIFFK